MATKINETIWGAIPENDGNVRFGNSIATIIGNNNYNPETGNIELSISPWGIGYSNAGNTSIMYATRTGGASSTSGNRIRRLETNGSASRNTPFALVSNYNIWNGSTTSATKWKNIIPSQKLYGETKKSESNNYVVSDSNIDKNDYPPNCSMSTYSNSVGDMKPAVYLSYQDYKLCISAFSYVNLSTGSVTRINMTASTWNSFVSTINAMDLNNFGLINIEYYQCARRHNAGSANSWSEQEYEAIQPLNKIPVNDAFRKFYFSKDSTTDYIQLRPCCRVGQFYPEVTSWSSNGGAQFPIEGRDFGTSATYHSSSGGYQGYVGIWDDTPLRKSFGAYVNNGSWTFDDISYKTDCKYWQVVNSAFQEYHVNDVFSYSGTMYSAPITTITDTSYNTNAESVKALLLHEIAFYGFPFTWRPDSDSLTSSIGDNNVYVPEFDSHMITTGAYKKGVDALTLPNALWQNVFDDTIPTYDPTYKPETPAGDENDSGALDNSIYRNIRLGGSNYFYALNETELHNFINFVNGLYLGDADDTQLKLDFKGSNPNDYIVGVFAYPFNIPNVVHASNIYLGCVESTVNANVVRQSDTGYFSFGSLTVDENNFDFLRGDFRDYAPYTQIELYIPLCGTVELDAAFYVGHTITVDGIYDINTGSLTMRILRDNIVDRTFDASIAVQIPITSRNMGDYQNNIHQMRMNLINASIGGVQTAEKTVTGAIAQSQSNNPLSGLSESGFDIGASGFAAGQAIANAKYQLSHTQPRPCMTSTASSANSIQMYNKCILFVKRAKMLSGFSAETYGKTVGYACLKNTTLSDTDISGFTICSDCDLSGIPATADEINAIQNALHNGIYV